MIDRSVLDDGGGLGEAGGEIALQAARRRTFAIISHPDAGKTTLTEKLLLYGGAILLAGSVKAKRNQPRVTSDWMEMERERGISITSTVLQFEYGGHVLNLLDTPGHNDFSADTYRTLTAADSAVMLIDNAKGVEPQTKKLFAVCSQRGIPIFTFINKMDHPGLGPLSLLSEVEDVLGIQCIAMNWPIGDGRDFKGVYDRSSGDIHLFQRTPRGASKVLSQVIGLNEAGVDDLIGSEFAKTLKEEVELLDAAGASFDLDKVLTGKLSPVFFGSAITNFGVELFLQRFLEIAPAPGPRLAADVAVTPVMPFSGFVFKIQANMDPNHRDRIAFMRIVSGKFEKDMDALNTRSGRGLRLSRPQRLFGQERQVVDFAYPGDIVGLTNPGAFKLGDTVTSGAAIRFDEVPSFPPEVFASIRNLDVTRLKHFDKGLQQLSEEGLVDLFWDKSSSRREPILGAVGRLQFEVVQHRLKHEYGVSTSLEQLPFDQIRWIIGPQSELEKVYWGRNARLVHDGSSRPVALITGSWVVSRLVEAHPEIKFQVEVP